MKIRTLAAALFSMAMVGGAAHAQNLLTNGSFETGDFSGWTVVDPSGYTLVTGGSFDGFSAEDGSYFAALGAVGADGTVSQTFSDIAGKNYEVSFYLASDGGTPNDFGVTGPGGVSLPTQYDVPASDYNFYFAYFVGDGTDTITFNERDDPGYFALDNVSVSLAAQVPEPAAWATMLLGMGLAGAALRRRRRVTAI